MKVEFVGSMAARARGLLGRRDFDGVLAMCPCDDIHTFGMAFPIDVAFVARDGTVLGVCRDMGPFRREKRKGAVLVLERKASSRPWPNVGERIKLDVSTSERRENRT